MPRVRDVLEHSVTMIDDHDGTALRRMPKGAEVPMQQAVRDFVRRDMSTPGPTTYVYVPPSVGRDYETKPPPRSIDELIDYTNTTQHVDAVTDERCASSVDFAWSVLACVEINQCVGCTRQFLTKSFLGDDAAVLASSSGEESASSRHRAGLASMAWRTTR